MESERFLLVVGDLLIAGCCHYRPRSHPMNSTV
jgi:hypothetical protein